ncbi:MAG: sialidase family protein [Sphingobacteriaceae bacterium]
MKRNSNSQQSSISRLFLVIILAASFTTIACSKKDPVKESTDRTQVPEKDEASVSAATYNYINLFPTSGNTSYHSYRIPAIIRSKNGVLIAVCEARKNSDEDYGDIDVVCRRLLKNSDGTYKTGTSASQWTTQQIIAGYSNVTINPIGGQPTPETKLGTWGNPTLVVNQNDGKVWLFMSYNDKDHSQTGAGGLSPINLYGQRRVFSCYSTDDGATWSTPVDRTLQVTPSSYKWDAVGPGIGIQKRFGSTAGRLIIPANGRNIYSDDNGATWTSSPVPSGTSESTIVEKLNGTLYRNDRPAPKPESSVSYRRVSSGNIGSWTSAFTNDTELPDPACQGSILRYNDPKPNRIFFMNSNSQTQRRWPHIKITYDEGGSWPRGRSIPQNGTGILGGYSSLVKTGDNMTGALIEYNTGSSMILQYHKFNLSWILNGASEPTGY